MRKNETLAVDSAHRVSGRALKVEHHAGPVQPGTLPAMEGQHVVVKRIHFLKKNLDEKAAPDF